MFSATIIVIIALFLFFSSKKKSEQIEQEYNQTQKNKENFVAYQDLDTTPSHNQMALGVTLILAGLAAFLMIALAMGLESYTR